MQVSDARERIQAMIAPVLGETMARSAVQAQCQKLGITDGVATREQLGALVEKIGQGLNVFMGRDKAQQLVGQMRDALTRGEAGR
jgi:hypothetical protein